MTRRRLLAVAALAAAVAMGLTLWFSGARETPRAAPAPRERAAHPRVVALAPGVAQIVRDLGIGRLLVGRHANDTWSDAALPSCGDQEGIDYERLIAVNPTHVFLQWGVNPLPERLTSLAAEKGWTVRNVPLLKLNDIHSAVILVYDTTAAQELAALRWEQAQPHATPGADGDLAARLANAPYTLFERFERAMQRDETLAGAGRILLLYQGEGEQGGTGGHPAALGPGSYHHDLLIALGGRTATEDGKPFMPLDAEDVSNLRPDGIIVVRPRSSPRTGDSASLNEQSDQLFRSLGVLVNLNVPAISNKRIALIDDPMALVPGTNLVTVADRMREILKGWAGKPAAAPQADQTERR